MTGFVGRELAQPVRDQSAGDYFPHFASEQPLGLLAPRLGRDARLNRNLLAIRPGDERLPEKELLTALAGPIQR